MFETLYIGEEEVTSHTDIEDEGQTVAFVEGPKIGTTATVDGQHTADPTGEITIVDVVEYTGLTPGETYTVSGVLMDKATGNTLLVDGAEVTWVCSSPSPISRGSPVSLSIRTPVKIGRAHV